MHINSIDHLVLTVFDIEETCRFYEHVLGADVLLFASGRRALRLGGQKINLHASGHEISPYAMHPTVGSGDFCLLTDVPIELVMEHMKLHRVPIVLGPIEREGAVSRLVSIYIRDPDGNLVEVANQVG